jgi:putative proteasome-type protease
LKQIFESIEDPVWNAPDQGQPVALSVAGNRSHPVRIQPPAELRKPDKGEASLQSVAQENGDRQH